MRPKEGKMLIPEEQAKMTMWCPMVRVRWPNKVVAGNRVNPGHKDRLTNALFRAFFPRLHWLYRAKYYRCWGSGCMMWRWEGGNSKRGYCGLAGSPANLLLSGEEVQPQKNSHKV
jgi:hypothetical protein